MHLRSKEYLLLVGFAAVLGVLAATVTLLFLWTEHGLQELLWHRLPDALGVDPHPWFALAVTTLGGLAVGLVIRFVPGHGGPGPAEGHGVGETHISLGVHAALVSLAVGASLGPEAPLLAIAAALVASTTGFFGFRLLTHSSLDSLANLAFPSYDSLQALHVLEGIAIGAAGAAAGV
jgi:hypothetical protein